MSVENNHKTPAFLIWLFLLGILGVLSSENLPVTQTAPIERVSLNSAQLEDLMQVPKIRFKTAKAILSMRNKLGAFKSFEDLEGVSGVGPKTLEKLKTVFKI